MKTKLALAIVVFLLLSFIILVLRGHCLPAKGEEEILEEKLIQNVTLVESESYNNLNYQDTKNNIASFSDLTLINTPQDYPDIKKILKEKIPVDIYYKSFRTFDGKFWEYHAIAEITLATKKQRKISRIK
ncbi:MAG: hypothetical protein US70_C0011G0047 [Parcubacteria group bacterium GW2011_GWD2_38_11]|nr:MAG: hypothetical protein US70_C0011G0047 [Parcubacteria group bacterium GW2011_GWD2_38_11]